MQVRFLTSLRFRIIVVIVASLCLLIGGSYTYIIGKQSRQFVETIKEQAKILTHAIVKSIQHDMRGTCQKDIQQIFERIGIIPEIESLRIFNQDGRVTTSADPKEVGLTIEDIGYEIFKANIPSTPYLGGHGQNAFCMVEPIKNEASCLECHEDTDDIMGIFELCLSMHSTDRKIADNRRFLATSALVTIALISVILALFFTLTIDRPIEKLIRVMAKAESGDLSIRSGMSRPDEIGRLAASFDTMIGHLDQTKREVERYHTEQLIRADRLATIGELAAGVAHEIKNPLAGISGAVQVLADDFDPRDPRRTVIEQVVRQTERMDKTIRDLLSFAQPLQPELSLVDVNEVVRTSLFISIPNPATAGIEIVTDLAADLPPVFFDSTHLQQVLVNIVLNALQAMPRGGRITLASRLHRDPDMGDVLRLAVADTGPGISPEASGKIFTPFFTTKTEGTGLGLSITRRIMEMHNSRISYQSTPGEGTTFFIDIPVQKPVVPL
jgi:signal transduction histidine kinase